MNPTLPSSARGAFTGAHATRPGFIASAEKGTRVLDERGELALAAQGALLRVLQAREYTSVGETRARRCDGRFVAVTNRDLRREVRDGRFREDLFFRLNVVHVHLPALRDRASDIPTLAKELLRRHAGDLGRGDVLGIAPQALEALVRGAWPCPARPRRPPSGDWGPLQKKVGGG